MGGRNIYQIIYENKIQNQVDENSHLHEVHMLCLDVVGGNGKTLLLDNSCLGRITCIMSEGSMSEMTQQITGMCVECVELSVGQISWQPVEARDL